MIPWKLVVFLVLAVLLALFIGFNLENKCEISFVFGKIDSVPVYMTVLISFAAGLVAALPFSFRRRKKKPRATNAPGSANAPGVADAPGSEEAAKGEGRGESAPNAAGGGLMQKAAKMNKGGKKKKASDGRAERE